MTIEDLTKRLIELETRVAFQEDALAQLDELLSIQDREILQLNRLVKRYAEKIAEMEYSAGEGGEGKPFNEKPPHY